MEPRTRWIVALALLGALPAAPHPSSAQEPGAGSVVPCAVPLAWTIADVDPRFGVSEDAALAAARSAAAMWEDAVGRELFGFGGASASPIRLEYDDRQERLTARNRLREALDAASARLEGRRAGLDEARTRLERAQAGYEDDARAYERRMAAYNDDVRRWNDRGGAPPEVRAELDERRAALAEERAALREREGEVRRLYESVRAETDELNRLIDEQARREERFAAEHRLSATESGRYDESVRWEDGRVVAVSRAIRVFRFSDRAELALVLAHELGHALGLGHASGRGAVMSEVIASERTGGTGERTGGTGERAGETGQGAGGSGRVSATDVAMLAARCPALAGSAQR